MPYTLHTIGHSNRSLDEFFRMLHQADIRQLIDVRSKPYSQHAPSYSQNILQLACEDEGIAYHWEGRDLGGLRRTKSTSPHDALSSDYFRGYADHMTTPSFESAIGRAIQLAQNTPTGLMCAERDPRQCHRTLIADYLTLKGWHVIHLLAPQNSIGHCLHPLARIQDNSPIYDLLNEEQLTLGL